jgi:lipooligosaccharide transport system ATP-binding protein
LIASHIEPQVVEIFGEGAAAWAPPAGSSASASRWPATPPSSTATTPRRCSPRWPAKPAPASGLRYVHRAASLEDVFLKLTGRDLRD